MIDRSSEPKGIVCVEIVPFVVTEADVVAGAEIDCVNCGRPVWPMLGMHDTEERERVDCPTSGVVIDTEGDRLSLTASSYRGRGIARAVEVKPDISNGDELTTELFFVTNDPD